jgi:addiction module RelE/StbE family toxin
MRLEMHKTFLVSLRKRVLPKKALCVRFRERLEMFESDCTDPVLKDHSLVGKKSGYRAFSVTGDVRVVYKMKDGDTALLVDIGSHNQVY